MRNLWCPRLRFHVLEAIHRDAIWLDFTLR